jgi:hypothetical protein
LLVGSHVIVGQQTVAAVGKGCEGLSGKRQQAQQGQQGAHGVVSLVLSGKAGFEFGQVEQNPVPGS